MPRKSDLWPKHFTLVTDKDGKSLRKATCNYCKNGKEYVTKDGTSNLKRHLERFHPKEAAAAAQKEGAAVQVQQQPPCPPSGSGAPVDRDPRLDQDEAIQYMEEDATAAADACAPSRHGGSSDRESSGLQEEACKHLARMIALRGYDASVLEDDCFRSFVRSLNPDFEVPSRVSIENMCDGIFDEARRDLLDRLRRAPGKVSVAVGTAEAIGEQFVYVACHFIDDGWNLHKLLLHGIVTTYHRSYYEGPILGLDVEIPELIEDRVWQVISDHGIGNRLLSLACETTYHDIGLGLSNEYSLWPPFTNANRKEILFYVDNVLHSVAQCLLRDFDLTGGIGGLFCDMENFRLTRQERLKLFAELGLHYGWAHDEHWYPCYCSLKVLCKKGFPPGKLRSLEFIAISKLFCKVWEEINCAIQKISSSTCPTANLCLVELFNLREILHPDLEWYKNGDHEDVHHEFSDIEYVSSTLKEANGTLDEAIKDSYLAWSLPLAMDPRYKLQFITSNLKKAYDSEAAEEYVSNVTTMITDLYADYVKQYGTTQGADHSDGASSAMDITTSADGQLGQARNEPRSSQQGMSTQVSSCYPDGAHHSDSDSELDRYLKDPLHDPQAEGFDILDWWKTHSRKYPTVARMARDALAMPTCSKLSSDQMAQVKSILRGYSKEPYGAKPFPQ